MAGFIDSHYWLFTGRDWEQDRDNFACNTGFCDHDHITRDSKPTTNNSPDFTLPLIMFGVIMAGLIGMLVLCIRNGW